MAIALFPSRCCLLYCPGVVPYRAVLAWQRSLIAERKLNPAQPDCLILVQHPPIYTLGQGSDRQYLKFDPAHADVDLIQVERGGEVTYHCPGQLVGYPILNLTDYQKDLHWYLRQLEEVLIRAIATYGLSGDRVPGLTGVWVENCKVAAIGIKVSRWITMHGFALNVCPDLTGFQQIIPCGIADKPVGSLEQFVPAIPFGEVQQRVAIAFSEVFKVELIERPNPALSHDLQVFDDLL